MGTQSAMLATASATASSFAGLSFRLSLLLVLAYLFVLWLLLLKFVWEDSRERSDDRLFIRISVLLVLIFNFPGLLLYLISRPSLTMRERERVLMEWELLRLELEKLRKGEDKKQKTRL